MLKHLTIAAAIAAASASSAMAEQVKLGLQPWLGYGPLWVAEEKGFFDKHGVDVELSNFNWDQDMLAALASGNLHVIAGATNGVITSYNQGFLSKATSSLQQVFKSLISEAVSMLNEFLPVFKGKKANMQPY